ncbi:MAG: serine/threonine protein kinase [Xanthobacteraceae bacterium]|nr:serine/threonine protein kinase [Xanthobacteraceae bacterium]MCW5673746.1 serine/threonine protein kinase [Xanthobacteraceae bacterium]
MSHDPHALPPGASIAGYNIVRVLGAGGFGITYEADSPFTGKRVAIKEFFPRGIASRGEGTRLIYAAKNEEVVQWALKRFESSTLDQCKLKHPNIVDVIHYVKDNGTGYMIMEYVEGETLEHWLRARETPPVPEELRPLMEPVLSALEYLHGRRMIHRDIAPDNIMIRADGQPMIIDFGAIKLIEQETQIRSHAEKSFLVAKQFYSPPEQIDAEGELDSRADIYAAGAVLYRALAGRPPATAEDRMQKLAFGKSDPIRPLASLVPELPHEITAAIDRALSFNAEHRQSNIGQLRAALGWSENPGFAPTIALPRDADRRVDATPHRREAKRSKLPWLLPLAGIAAVLIAALALSGVITFPAKKEIVETQPPAPKLDDMKVVPQMQVHTPPEQETPKEQTAKENEPKVDQPEPLGDRETLIPPAMVCPPGEAEAEGKCAPASEVLFPKWYTGEVQLYRAVPNDLAQPLTACVPGRRLPVRVEVEGERLRVTLGSNIFFADLKPNGAFDFESAAGENAGNATSLLQKTKVTGTITAKGLSGEFITTTGLGSCYGRLTARPG